MSTLRPAARRFSRHLTAGASGYPAPRHRAEVTLTVKEITHDGIDGTDETEIVVDDFDTANELLGQLGFTPKSYQENRRASFTLDGARLEIDTWPLIPPYLEIEADSPQHVIDTAALLGYHETQLTGENTIKIYARYGIDLNTTPELRFALVAGGS